MKWINEEGQEYYDGGYFGGYGFRVTKVADPRWEDKFKVDDDEYPEIGYYEGENNLPVEKLVEK